MNQLSGIIVVRHSWLNDISECADVVVASLSDAEDNLQKPYLALLTPLVPHLFWCII